MPFCTQCGSRNPEGAKFCAQCGTKLVDSLAESSPVDSTATITFGAPVRAQEAEERALLDDDDAAAVATASATQREDHGECSSDRPEFPRK